MTPEQELSRKRRAVAAARTLLSLESGLVYGAQRVRGALSRLGHDATNQFPTFDLFLKAIPMATPVGELRLLCTDQLLFESDEVLALLEAKYRQPLLRQCLEIIQAWG